LPAAAACLLLLCVAAVCGCGSGGGRDLQTIRVGVVPIADAAPLYLGREKGFFADVGLTVDPQPASGGAAIIPPVLDGQLEFGFSNTISLLIAASQGRRLAIVASGALGGTDERRAWANLLVRRDGDIEEAADLQGRTIGVNSLGNICEVAIKASLEKQGVDVATLTFAEMPFADMAQALQSGRVAAICAVEPVLSHAEGSGARGIDPFYIRTAPDLTVAAWFTSARYARTDAEVVARFRRAMNRSLAYAQAHPDEARRILPSYMDIAAGLARRIRLPTWRPDLNRPTIALLARLAEKYGLIERRPDLDTLVGPTR
jgi:NitT/TauT family transport system substrate-binding protein